MLRLIGMLALVSALRWGDIIPGKGTPPREGPGSQKCTGCCSRCHGSSRRSEGGTGTCNGGCGGSGHDYTCNAGR